jgi:hypothetical protein
MRGVLLVMFAVLVLPNLAVAQSPNTAASPSVQPSHQKHYSRNADISRSDYIERAVERSRRRAEKRFDKLDTDHNGIVTLDERRAARAARHAATAAH